LLKVNVPALMAINELPGVIMATLPNNTPVKDGDMLAGTKVIPLSVKEQLIEAAENVTARLGKVLRVAAYRPLKVGIVVTGSEVYAGLIQDRFAPVLKDKVEAFGSETIGVRYAPDDPDRIALLIGQMIDSGAQLVMVSGGMSVDPDDATPRGIALSGAQVETYGAPVLPGAMFMIAYHGDVPVIGIPACGMYFHTTILDLVLPRLLTGERLKRKDFIALGHGGLCRSCRECRYPYCSFGLGGA
jgi:molybdopterin biosynthesis enzyme